MYSESFSKEVSDMLLDAHPRGWAFIEAKFFIRREDVKKIFSIDQKLWYQLKVLVKRYDKIIKYKSDINKVDVKKLVFGPCKLFWHYLRHADYLDTTDRADLLLFPHQPS